MSFIINGLLVVLIVLRLVVGVQLFFSARRNQLRNLYWLSAFFIVNFLGVPFATTSNNPVGNWPGAMWVFNGVLSLCAGPCLLLFIDTTFYLQRRSPRGWFWAAFGLGCALGFYGLAQSPSAVALSPWVATFYVLNALVWGWHWVAAAEAYQAIANDSAVAGWVKNRYQLMIWAAGFHMLAALANVVRVVFTGGALDHPLGNATALVALVGNLANIVLQFIIWVIPEQFWAWQTRAASRTASQTTGLLTILVQAMVRNTDLTEFFAGYTLRTVATRVLTVPDPAEIDQYLARLSYQEWLTVLEHPELGQLLQNATGAALAHIAVQQAKQALIEKQALFTLQTP